MTLSIDHIVLTVNDMDKTIKFYCDVLGMTLKRVSTCWWWRNKKVSIFWQLKDKSTSC